MKKLNLWMLAAILCCGPMTAQAEDEQEFEVISGNFEVVKQKGKTGTVEFDYENAKVGNLHSQDVGSETLMEYLEKNDEKAFRKWADVKEEGKEMFIDRWNDEKSRCIKLVEKGSADYQIKIKAELFDPGNSGSATWSWNKRDGGIIISGTLEVFDASGKSVCKMKINRYRGASSRNIDLKVPTFSRRVILFHKSLAKDLLETLD
jgi:hypothetical protein